MLPSQVPKAMKELVGYVTESSKDTDIKNTYKHPLAIATYFHQQFLKNTHPFSDGNGRIGRIFTNLILLKKGYPPIFIKEVNKQEYPKRFELSDEDIQPMLDFKADRLFESLKEKLEFMKNQK